MHKIYSHIALTPALSISKCWVWFQDSKLLVIVIMNVPGQWSRVLASAGDNDLSESVTRDTWHRGPHGVMSVMSSHASSHTVLLITYLHNGINTPSLSRRNILAPLYSRHSLNFPSWLPFFQTSRPTQASPSFSGRDIAKGSRTRFYIRLFLGRKSVFLQLWTLSLKRLMPPRMLNNFSDTHRFLVKFSSQRIAQKSNRLSRLTMYLDICLIRIGFLIKGR